MSGPVTLAGRIAGDLHAVLLAVVLRLPLVEDLVHRVLHVAMAKIVLGDHAVAEEFLFAVDRQRAGIDNPVAAGEARRLEAVVHAEDVELEGDPRRVLAADQIGEVDDPLGLGRGHRRHDVVELGDVAAQHFHLLAEVAEIGGLRIDIHADDLFAALRKERNEPSPDKPGATGDEGGHGCPSSSGLAARSAVL